MAKKRECIKSPLITISIESDRTLKVGNGDGVSILGFLNAGSVLLFFIAFNKLESPAPSELDYI